MQADVSKEIKKTEDSQTGRPVSLHVLLKCEWGSSFMSPGKARLWVNVLVRLPSGSSLQKPANATLTQHNKYTHFNYAERRTCRTSMR